ncbi:TCR/Tet family MFS transporter [Mucilaginibacter phyllosphaerae]|uniref:MFS transporter n=1 Tax=Mucilaginibacter phyllosphaerae TaxID=1812349 RepID=A0A4Y8ADA7_9SPHI|nr:TCR/Tet family MFS transporter [Mucilaginibacter phyllosphaerae]MBB3969285.1 DHA1 family tetracycline resistance protein-like MFS transporter [Mucilaginibacter phyllosphaerae]TEW65918.1 MFS transporter [Mucilaginibacter phyllosphaerae]GGH07422.1 tetracycline resistance MFS efflux pump [Mucilaginibacter phyllosphaerae]
MDALTQPKKKAALSFIFITLLIDVIGLAIIIPVFPKLIEKLIHGDISQASRYSGLLLVAYAVMQFLFSPLVGNLSDKYGRRPVLLLSLLGFGVDYLFLAFAPTIGWLFVGRIIAGITGASFTTASAYIADVSEPEKRAQNFGMIGVAFGLGFIIGPVIGGVLGKMDTHYPFYAAAALALINAAYGFFILPESLDKEHRREFDWKRANPLGSLLQLKKYPAVIGLAACLFIVYFASHAVQSVWTFYTMEKFKWTEDVVGYSLGFIGLMIAIVQGGLIRVAIPKLGQNRSIWLGLLIYAVGMLLFGLANQSWMMFAFMIPYSLGGICGPALQGVMTNEVPKNEQGELQGGLTSLMSLSSIFGPWFMTYVFYYFTSPKAPVYLPGAPYYVAAVLMLIGAVLAVRSFKKEKQTDMNTSYNSGLH